MKLQMYLQSQFLSETVQQHFSPNHAALLHNVFYYSICYFNCTPSVSLPFCERLHTYVHLSYTSVESLL